MKPHRSYLFLYIALAWQVSAARWAILTDYGDTTSANLAEVLGADLSERGLDLVTRQDIDAALAEQELTGLIGSQAVKQRRGIAAILGADAMVILKVGIMPNRTTGKAAPAWVRMILADTQTGLRLEDRVVDWQPALDDMVASLAQAIAECPWKLPEGRGIVSVSPFICENLGSWDVDLAPGLTALCEQVVQTLPDFFLVELKEAQAFADEAALATGAGVFKHRLPLFIRGSYRTVDEDRFAVTLRGLHPGADTAEATFQTHRKDIVHDLRRTLLEQIGSGDTSEPQAFDPLQESRTLRRRAKELALLGHRLEAIPLLLAARLALLNAGEQEPPPAGWQEEQLALEDELVSHCKLGISYADSTQKEQVTLIGLKAFERALELSCSFSADPVEKPALRTRAVPFDWKLTPALTHACLSLIKRHNEWLIAKKQQGQFPRQIAIANIPFKTYEGKEQDLALETFGSLLRVYETYGMTNDMIWWLTGAPTAPREQQALRKLVALNLKNSPLDLYDAYLKFVEELKSIRSNRQVTRDASLDEDKLCEALLPLRTRVEKLLEESPTNGLGLPAPHGQPDSILRRRFVYLYLEILEPFKRQNTRHTYADTPYNITRAKPTFPPQQVSDPARPVFREQPAMASAIRGTDSRIGILSSPTSRFTNWCSLTNGDDWACLDHEIVRFQSPHSCTTVAQLPDDGEVSTLIDDGRNVWAFVVSYDKLNKWRATRLRVMIFQYDGKLIADVSTSDRPGQNVLPIIARFVGAPLKPGTLIGIAHIADAARSVNHRVVLRLQLQGSELRVHVIHDGRADAEPVLDQADTLFLIRPPSPKAAPAQNKGSFLFLRPVEAETDPVAILVSSETRDSQAPTIGRLRHLEAVTATVEYQQLTLEPVRSQEPLSLTHDDRSLFVLSPSTGITTIDPLTGQTTGSLAFRQLITEAPVRGMELIAKPFLRMGSQFVVGAKAMSGSYQFFVYLINPAKQQAVYSEYVPKFNRFSSETMVRFDLVQTHQFGLITRYLPAHSLVLPSNMTPSQGTPEEQLMERVYAQFGTNTLTQNTLIWFTIMCSTRSTIGPWKARELEAYKELIQRFPSPWHYRKYLGCAGGREMKPEEAVPLIQACMEAYPETRQEMLRTEFFFYLRAKNRAESLKAFEALAETAPSANIMVNCLSLLRGRFGEEVFDIESVDKHRKQLYPQLVLHAQLDPGDVRLLDGLPPPNE